MLFRSPATSWRMNVGQATISRIRTAPGNPALLSFNADWHLDGVEG